uniref:Zinc finger protein 91-like n=1 Tax=Kryptolebias marmoratus TaxID=37003 RepID=A0A3Q3B4A2_KRYMA
MDESAAAVIREDDADKNYSHNDDETCENNNNHPSPEDSRDGVGAFCCRDCGAAFREEAAYLEHRRLHPQQNTYLNSQSDAEKDNETPYLCTLCSLSFVEINELRSHLKNHNQTSLKESVIVNNSGLTKHHTYVCPDCGKSYNVIGYFLNHLRSHKQASKSVFNNLEHLKKKSFQCESCGRNYSRASALDAHRRCHEEKLIKSKNRSLGGNVETGESAAEPEPNKNQPKNDSGMHFKCSCGKRFLTWSRLKTHQRFSRYSRCATEEMKQKQKKSSSKCYCTGCKKTFRGHAALVNHQRCHAIHMTISKERFTCEECGKVFKTRTFYHKHQRLVHNAETPAKSFLHQVCQVQKKAFECKDCGRKFSRASALQSHQLQLCFKETDREPQTHPSLPHQDIISEGCGIKSEHSAASLEEKVQSETFPAASTEDESFTNDTDNDTESCEAGDFNVQVISGSESEDEAAQDLNPDLELLCESDQDVRDDAAGDVSPGCLMSKSDLKIVQIDFDQTSGEFELMESGAETQTAEQRLDCPECYRWFTNPTSLRVHRMWHGLRKRRQQNQDKESSILCNDCGLMFTHVDSYLTHLHQHALEEEEAQLEDSRSPAVGQETREDGDEDVSEDGDEDGDGDGDRDGSSSSSSSSSSAQTQLPELTQNTPAASKKEPLPKGYGCLACGKMYFYLESFKKHLKLHSNPPSAGHNWRGRSQSGSEPGLRSYECPDCGVSFIRKTSFISHLRVHRSRKRIRSSLLRCDQCNKSFTNVKSWMSHTKLHKRRRFWCLSCARGFLDEALLDKHLQRHSLRQNSHGSEDKSSQMVKEEVKGEGYFMYPSPFCEKSFSHNKQLSAHQIQHLQHLESHIKTLGPSTVNTKGQEFNGAQLTSVEEEEEDEMNANAEELQTTMAAEGGDPENSEESDCGEPMHRLKVPKPPDEPGTETTRPPAEWDQGKKEPTVHREHKYWEWECIECDMGFDEMAKLHLHYIKHATGEVPIPQHDP